MNRKISIWHAVGCVILAWLGGFGLALAICHPENTVCVEVTTK